jgi:hypothetical protein
MQPTANIPSPRRRRQNDIDDLRLTAVTVQDDQPSDAGARDTAPDFGQHGGQGLGEQGQSAGKADVLHRQTDRLDGKREHRRIGRDEVQSSRQKAGVDRGIDADRQMRPGPVLLDRRDRQDGDRVVWERPGIGPGEVLPVP